MKRKRQGKRGTTLKAYLAQEMKDPEFRRLYAEADLELRIALEVIRARESAHLTQTQLAARIRSKQQTVSRLERGSQNVTIGTLQKIARATGQKVQVRFVR